MLHLASLIAAALFVSAAWAQETRSTKVYGVVADYSDTRSFPGGPEKLRRILRTARSFHAEGSGGAHDLVAEVHPVLLQLPQARPPGRCQRPDTAALSAALREAGIDLGGRHALVLVVPPSAQGCPGGVQTVFRHVEADGTTRAVPLAASWSLTERYVTHEIVHTYGVGHANSLSCHKATLAADCRVREYGNAWDLMGHDGGGLRMISAPIRAYLGWTRPLVHQAGRATYTIGAATRAGGLPTAVEVRLPRAGGDAVKVQTPLALWVEYRAAYGFGTRMARARGGGFPGGAMVNLTGSWRSGTGDKARTIACARTAPCLLDMTPSTPTFGDAALAVGQTWTHPFTGTRITVDGRTDTALTVTVSSP